MGEVQVKNWVLSLQSKNAVLTGFNALHQSEIGRNTKKEREKKVLKAPSHHSKNKTDTQCHRSKAPYTLQQRTRVTDPGSVVYI